VIHVAGAAVSALERRRRRRRTTARGQRKRRRKRTMGTQRATMQSFAAGTEMPSFCERL